MAFKRAFNSHTMAACSGLMALLLLSMLCLVQSEAAASRNVKFDGAKISTARQGDTVALLRITSKVPALEIRTDGPVGAKFVGGNPAALSPDAVFLWADRVSPIQAVAVSAIAYAPQVNTNQPRAPPST